MNYKPEWPNKGFEIIPSTKQNGTDDLETGMHFSLLQVSVFRVSTLILNYERKIFCFSSWGSSISFLDEDLLKLDSTRIVTFRRCFNSVTQTIILINLLSILCNTLLARFTSQNVPEFERHCAWFISSNISCISFFITDLHELISMYVRYLFRFLGLEMIDSISSETMKYIPL